uniref:Uncharacterized protein n=1 Tax=Oryza barthii TaxID=65489 RepID=A0A0D3EJ26_9ORYZ
MAATAASVVLARWVVTKEEVEMGVLPAPTARAAMAATAGLPGLPRLLSTSSNHEPKKIKYRAISNGEVKQERQEEEAEEGEVSQEEESAKTGPLVVATTMSMDDPQIDVRIAVGLLHCHACLLPLKPPVFMEITYRAVHPLVVSASRRRLLLAVRGDGDGGAEQRRVFLLAVGAHGAAATVSVSCVRANAAAGPRYVCKVWTQAPPDAETGVKDTIMMEANVRSFSVPGEVAMDDGTVLCVPPRMLHGASMEMPLRVRIDKLGAGATNRSAIAAQTKK